MCLENTFLKKYTPAFKRVALMNPTVIGESNTYDVDRNLTLLGFIGACLLSKLEYTEWVFNKEIQ